MRVVKKIYLLRFIALGCWLVAGGAFADQIQWRMLGGVGAVSSDYKNPAAKKKGNHVGMQILHLIQSGPFPHSWGLEAGKHTLYTGSGAGLKYDSFGLIVESRPLTWLLASIGTVGYQNTGNRKGADPYGIRAAIGVDWPLNKYFTVLGMFRQEKIFDGYSSAIVSAEIGLQLCLWRKP